MKLPNVIVESVKGNALKVACKLYSLISNNRTSRNGYEVCIKQSTLAKACGLSLSTVKRSLAELEEKNIITNKYRTTHDNGYQGCYHYSLAFFNKYFYMRHDVFEFGLSAQEFTLYAAMCKLRTNFISSFYQSLNDLRNITGISKNDICRLCRSLISCGLIRKQLKRTKQGDYTDNTYFIIIRRRGTFKKKAPKALRTVFKYIISSCKSFVKPEKAKKFTNGKNGCAFYYTRGSG